MKYSIESKMMTAMVPQWCERLRQEDYKFECCLGNLGRTCLETKYKKGLEIEPSSTELNSTMLNCWEQGPSLVSYYQRNKEGGRDRKEKREKERQE